MIPDHERSLSFVQGMLDAAERPKPHAITLYPETMIHIRRIVDRVQELERRDQERRTKNREAASKGGKIGGPKGGSSTSEKKRAASRDNLAKGRAVRSSRITSRQDPESGV